MRSDRANELLQQINSEIKTAFDATKISNQLIPALVALFAHAEVDDENAITKEQFNTLLDKTVVEKNSRDASLSLSTRTHVHSEGMPPEYMGFQPRNGNVIKDTARSVLISRIKKRVLAGRLTLLDALDECLSSKVGQHGPNSFKYMLICNLFGISGKDEFFVKAIVEAIGTAVKVEKEKINSALLVQTKRFIQDNFSKITTADFLRMLKEESVDEGSVSESESNAETESNAESESASESESNQAPKTSALSSVTKLYDSAVAFTQSTYKETKQLARAKLLADVEWRLANNKITNLEALYQALTLLVGQTGPHSDKFKLVYNLIENQKQLDAFGLKKENINANLARALVNNFVAAIKPIIDAERGINIMTFARARLQDKLPQIQISPETIKAFYDRIFQDKNEENAEVFKKYGLPTVLESNAPVLDKNYLSGIIENYRAGFVTFQNIGREKIFSKIFDDLQNEKITVLDAIDFLLKAPLGLTTELSFRYRLTALLFGLDENDAKYSNEMVSCFTAAIKEEQARLNQALCERVDQMLFLFRIEANMKFKFLTGLANSNSTKVKEAFDAKRADKEGLQAVFGLFQSGFKQVKNYVRSGQIDSIFADYNENKITFLKAFYDVLTLRIGKHSQHSLIYDLLFDLFGRKVGDAEDLPRIEKDDVRSAHRVIECFIGVVGEKLHAEQALALAEEKAEKKLTSAPRMNGSSHH